MGGDRCRTTKLRPNTAPSTRLCHRYARGLDARRIGLFVLSTSEIITQTYLHGGAIIMIIVFVVVVVVVVVLCAVGCGTDMISAVRNAAYQVAPLQRILGLPSPIGPAASYFLSRTRVCTHIPRFRLYCRRSKFFFSEGSFTDDMLRLGRNRRSLKDVFDTATAVKDLETRVIVPDEAVNVEARRRIALAKSAIGQNEASLLYDRLFGFSGAVEGVAKGVAYPGVSDIHGRGLFASVDIPKGSVVVCQRAVAFLDAVGSTAMLGTKKIPGLLRYVPFCGPAQQIPISPCATMLLNHSCEPNVKRGMRFAAGREAWRASYRLFPHEWEAWDDAAKSSTAVKMLNESDTMNVGSEEDPLLKEADPSLNGASSNSASTQTTTIDVDFNCFVTMRDIRMHEELTVDYGGMYSKGNDFDTSVRMASNDLLSVAAFLRTGKCNCGCSSCRGEIYPTEKDLKRNEEDLAAIDPLVRCSRSWWRGELIARLVNSRDGLICWRHHKTIDVAIAMVDAMSYMDDVAPHDAAEIHSKPADVDRKVFF